MSRRNIIITAIIALVAFGAGAGAGVLGFLWSTGGLETESASVQDIAPTLSLDSPSPTPGESAAMATQIAVMSSSLQSVETQVNALAESSERTNEQLASISAALAAGGGAVVEAATEEPEREAPAEATATPVVETAASGDVTARALYRISQEDSQVRFLIDEVFSGLPNTVIATTRRVAGDIIVDFANPPASQLGTIAINARTFRTDQEFRDDSIRGHILETDTHEFINFVPTALQGLPAEPVSTGSTVEFQIVGDLTVKGVTRSITFDATVTLSDEARIEGLARAQVVYQDFDITIRTPPLVTEVKDEVILEIEFVALRVDE